MRHSDDVDRLAGRAVLRRAPVLVVVLLAVACGPTATIRVAGSGPADGEAAPAAAPDSASLAPEAVAEVVVRSGGEVEGEPVPPTVVPGTCEIVVYTPPTASVARQGELCVPLAPAGTIVVLVHGGGGYEGDRSQTDAWRDVHLAAGRATLAIDYALLDPDGPRDAPLWPLPEQNVKAAVQFVRIDPTLPNDEVVVHGFSAGARLAGIAATTPNDPIFAGAEMWPDASDSVDGAVLFYGYFDGWQFHSESYYGAEIPDGAAAVEEIDASDPPLLIVHGTADTLIGAEQSIALAAAADAAGVDAELILVHDAWHVFDGYGQTALTEPGTLLIDDIATYIATAGASLSA